MWQMIKSPSRPWKMKVGHQDWAFRLFLMAVLGLTSSTGNEAKMCDIEIKVRRDTSDIVSVGEKLQLECPVVICNNILPPITWITAGFSQVNLSKRITTEWTEKHDAEKIFNLIFQEVLESDSGRYACKSGENAVSHFINITVTDALDNTSTPQETTNHTSTDPQNMKQLQLYLFTAAGIVGFVIIVILISVLSMRGCNRKGESSAQSENQYMDIPMTERVHRSSIRAVPRASPCGTPSHRNNRKTKSPSAPSQRDNVYGQMEGHRDSPEDHGRSVVYAALNHQHLAGASPRARAVLDETTEYAAIRLY